MAKANLGEDMHPEVFVVGAWCLVEVVVKLNVPRGGLCSEDVVEIVRENGGY